MNLEPVKQSEDKQISYINAYVWNLKGTDEPVCRPALEMQTESRLVDTREEGVGGTNWESKIEAYTLPYVKQIASGKLLYVA